MKKWIGSFAVLVSAVVLFSSCSSIPEKAKAVTDFETSRYLGKWYEIARIDFKHEKGLNNTTAQYSLYDDGTIKVVNRGFNVEKGEWTEAIGKAKFRGKSDIGELKVSFFGPFYSGYNVLAIDPEYNYSLVAGKDLDYLWILSRSTTIPDSIKQQYLQVASNAGYDTSRLLWIEHDKKQ